jgi:DNA-binding PadR family transcriptional regulator
MLYKGELDGVVLGVLQAAPAHGYEIVKRVKLISDGVLQVGEAKLYPCLHKLEAAGYISAEWLPQEGKPDRKVYTLTKTGISVLEQKRQSWQKFAQGIGSVLNAEEIP